MPKIRIFFNFVALANSLGNSCFSVHCFAQLYHPDSEYENFENNYRFCIGIGPWLYT